MLARRACRWRPKGWCAIADVPTTLLDEAKKIAPSYLKDLLGNMRTALGNRASDAVNLTPEEELGAWMRATATPEEVAQMVQSGADDKTIIKQARKYRYRLGKSASQGDPRKETEYHNGMEAKALAYQQGIAQGLPHPEAMAQALKAKAPPIPKIVIPEPAAQPEQEAA